MITAVMSHCPCMDGSIKCLHMLGSKKAQHAADLHLITFGFVVQAD